MILVDTSAWFAAAVSSDGEHAAAAAWMADNAEQLVTTDFIIDETLTLLRARNEREQALRMGGHFFGGRFVRVADVTSEDFTAAWVLFRDYADKAGASPTAPRRW